jgi:hypothetical protein
MIRLFAIFIHQRYPAQWPKQYQQDATQRPCLPSGKRPYSGLGFWLIAIGTLLQEHGIATTQIRIQSSTFHIIILIIIITIGTVQNNMVLMVGQVLGNGSRLGHGLQFGIGCYRNSAAFHFGKRYNNSKNSNSNNNGNRKGSS